jgi:enamine deaminase RidA (YjgF/YER057c/UK114 family)
MTNIKDRLGMLGLTLPEISKPGGNYISVNVRGMNGTVAVQFPKLSDEWIYKGRLGAEMTTENGYNAMQLCALNVLAHLQKSIDMEDFVGLNHVDAYFQAASGWDDSPKVVDGASDLFVNVLGDKGTHTRAIFGVDKLPRNFSVGISCSFTMANKL